MRKARRQNRPLPAWGLLIDKGLEPLFSDASLESLMEMVLSKDRLRKRIPEGPFGPRVSDLEEASRSLRRIKEVTERVLVRDLEGIAPEPRLTIDPRLSQLKSETVRCFMVFSALALGLAAASTLAWPEGQAFLPVAGASLSLLAIPLLIHRRTRIHLEHQCKYTTGDHNRGAVRMAQLPQLQFDSYLAHEFGHHLLRREMETREGSWRREGWARLFQWAIMNAMAEAAEEPAYLFHVLNQIIGELKFACEMICGQLRRPLPKHLRSVKTMFSTNPVWCLITGTPLTNLDEIAPHALGTAFYFLAAHREGLETVLRNPLSVSSRPVSPAGPKKETPLSPTNAKRHRGSGLSGLISG